ncbi:aldo/keto reductase [Microbacterium mangrovi]|uniref:aldo/keto reductase n=1 Tax=Microbacterium mangrovi TaxID=1348253 RepID=UPI0006920984|nr:aldo/keto reductase [Microbacterium mangrovi]
MSIFSIDEQTSPSGVPATRRSAREAAATTAPPVHPSAPIPVQGPAVGTGIRVPLGETGFDVFPLILGGRAFGASVGQHRADATLDAYVGRGGNAVYTADRWGAGRSEQIIGQWLSTRGLRDDIVLAVRVGGHPDNPGLGPVNLVRAVEASLTRLGTDRIDVLYLDGTGEPAALDDTLATAEWLVGAGKARALAAYGFTAEQLVEARIFASAGYPRFTVLDAPYSVVRRGDFDGDLRLVAGAQGIAVTPSHAVERSLLAADAPSAARIMARAVRPSQWGQSLQRRAARLRKALISVGASLGVSETAVAVAWLLAQRLIVAPIVDATGPQQIEDVVQGVGVHLSRAQLTEIARAAE